MRLHQLTESKQGVTEAVTPASVSKVLRLIQRHKSEWFDNYGMGEVEDTVVDMAEMGQFQGMSAVDALALVGQELESMYGQQDVAEGYPKHQDLSGISTEKLKAYLAKQSQQQVSGEGNQVKRVRAELQSREQGVAEGGYPEVDHMPGPTIKRTQTGCKRCHGKGHVYKTPDGETHPMNRPDAKKYKCGKCDGIGFVKVAEQGVAEDFNGEYDDEAGMAQSNLRTMARAVNGLIDTIKDNDNLPEWAQEKLAKAEMMTTSVWDYLLSQKEQGMDPKVTEASQRVDSLVTDALRIMRGSSMNDAVQALKTILGEREYNGRRGHYNFYVRQILDMYSQPGVQEDLNSQFDIIESWVEQLAEQHGVDADVIWEDFEELDDDDLLNESAAWQKKSGKNKNGGLNAKGVASYRRENPGSKLQTAVTTKPSKLKKGSKAAKRRKSFCARMGGMKGPMKKDNGEPTRKALALRKWNC
jgi:hypothetical protein